MAKMTLATVLALLGTGVIGGTIQSSCGFGFGVFVMILLPYFMPSYGEATAVSGLACVVTSFTIVYSMRSYIAWKQIPFPLCAYFITSFFAVRFCASSSSEPVEKFLGAALILLSIYLLVFSKRIHIRPTNRNGAIAGAVGGVMTGLFSMGGPPVVVYFTSCSEDKNVYLATIQTYFFISMTYVSAVRAMNGLVNLFVLQAAAICLAGAICGHQIGHWVFQKMDTERLKKLIYGFMAVSGLIQLL